MNDVADTSENKRYVIMHLGAHRTGTTLFQEYLYKITPFARDSGYTLIGIGETRSGMMEGLLGQGVLKGHLSATAGKSLDNLEQIIVQAKAEHRGLVISDENIMGSMEHNLECGVLYPDLADRLRSMRRALRHVDRFYISIRDLKSWWISCLCYLISTRCSPPAKEKIAEIALCSRSWENVISDIISVFPNAIIYVREFEYLIDNPKRQLMKVTDCKDFQITKRLGKRANKSKVQAELRKILNARGDVMGAARLNGDTAYRPFLPDHIQSMQLKYQGDLTWLRSSISRPSKFLESPKIG